MGSFSISSFLAPFVRCGPCSMPRIRITHGRQKHITGTSSMRRMHGRQIWMYMMIMYTRQSCSAGKGRHIIEIEIDIEIEHRVKVR